MEDARFSKCVKVKEGLDRAEQRNPDSRALRALHRRLGDVLEDCRDLFTEEQFIALGGGTPKSDDED